MDSSSVTVVTVTYGMRWDFLSQVVLAVMKDPHVSKLVIVDNGSKNKEEIEKGVEVYGDRVVILRQEKNIGSAGGFAVGLNYARGTESDFVFLLDDDNVPEEGAIAQFLETRKLFADKNIVLCGNRSNGKGNQDYFYQIRTIRGKSVKTFFEVFSFSKVIHFLKLIFRIHKDTSLRRTFIPVVPNESFIYGGVFMPIEAVKAAPLPDADLILYGDDIEYSWGVRDLGYNSYLCALPHIYDIDSSFGDSHILGLYDPKTQPFKVYYRIRNMVRISVRRSSQNGFILFLSILFWVKGLSLLAFCKYGFTYTYWKRYWLIVQAVYGGYVPSAKVPAEAVLP
jgi:GT2 family glycosyltransferase